MLAAWRRTPVTLPVPERMGRMLAEAAVSITITSVTDVLSFWIGLTSTFPSVQIFCLYTGQSLVRPCLRVIDLLRDTPRVTDLWWGTTQGH